MTKTPTMTAAIAAMMFAATALGAEKKATVPYEATAVGKLESRTKDRTRCPGIFGDYWWANRFLDRHQKVEKLKGKTVDLVLLGDSIMHFWEWKHPASWRKLTEGRGSEPRIRRRQDRERDLARAARRARRLQGAEHRAYDRHEQQLF
ncbi:MAG: hypothetical protein J6T51_07040 [Kiritimatiellae bacterium]|nr:hypothetical protein [Kiritimatiellia bacterium]